MDDNSALTREHQVWYEHQRWNDIQPWYKHQRRYEQLDTQIDGARQIQCSCPLVQVLPYIEQDRKQLENKLAVLEWMFLYDWTSAHIKDVTPAQLEDESNDIARFLSHTIIDITFRLKSNDKDEKHFIMRCFFNKFIKNDIVIYDHELVTIPSIIIRPEGMYAIIEGPDHANQGWNKCILTRKRADDLIAYIDERRAQNTVDLMIR